MASVNNESSFALTKRKLITPIKSSLLYSLYEKFKIHERGKLNCKVLPVMMTHLNSFKVVRNKKIENLNS